MSKPIKEMMRKELIRRFAGIESLAVVGFVGLDAVATNIVRGRLKEKQMRLTVVKNSLARQAFKEIGLSQAGDLLDGPCAIAYGGESIVDVVRELISIGKETPALTVKAALLDGEAFVGGERVLTLSNYPTRDEALATVVACALGPAGRLAGCLKAPGGKIAGILKTIEDNHAETGAAESN